MAPYLKNPRRQATNRRRNPLLSCVELIAQQTPAIKIMLDRLHGLVNGFDASNPASQRVYHACCVNILDRCVASLSENSQAFALARKLFDGLIETEYALFKRSTVLNFLIGFLIAKSDAAPSNSIYGRCLDYVLTTHDAMIGSDNQ